MEDISLLCVPYHCGKREGRERARARVYVCACVYECVCVCVCMCAMGETLYIKERERGASSVRVVGKHVCDCCCPEVSCTKRHCERDRERDSVCVRERLSWSAWIKMAGAKTETETEAKGEGYEREGARGNGAGTPIILSPIQRDSTFEWLRSAEHRSRTSSSMSP